jgi:hypothetical protein
MRLFVTRLKARHGENTSDAIFAWPESRSAKPGASRSPPSPAGGDAGMRFGFMTGRHSRQWKAAAPRERHGAFARLFTLSASLPRCGEYAEFGTSSAQRPFVKGFGDPRNIPERCGEQHRIVVARRQHARDAKAYHFRKDIEDLASAQIHVEEGAVGIVGPRRPDDAVYFRNRTDDLTSEMAKYQFEIERDEALVFDDENPQRRRYDVRDGRFPERVCVIMRRVHSSSSKVGDLPAEDV